MNFLLKNINAIGFKLLNSEINIFIDESGIIRNKVVSNTKYIKELDLAEYYLSPGWIDFHTHIFDGISNIGLNPDEIGPKTGVSVLVDAGSAGEVTYQGFKKYIIEPRNYPIYALLNLSSIGLIKANQISELDSMDKLDIDALVKCVEENRDYIKGIKLRASGVILRGWGFEIVKLAKKVSRETKLPLIVHVGEPPPLLEDILPLLAKGDIVTHYYHGKRWGIFDDNQIIKEVKDAVERGVLFDVGHGAASFNFIVAKKAIAKGFKPFIISTDLHGQNLNGPVWDLATTMSKMLAAGLSLQEVIEGVTINPAEVLDIESYQKGLIGKKARFTVFKIENKRVKLYDSNNNLIEVDKVISPKFVINGTEIIKASSRYKGN